MSAKASIKLQNQFADFKAEFAHICKSFGGVRNPRNEHTGGENSAFEIKTPWATVRASIGAPWNTIDGTMREGWRKSSTATIFLCADGYKSLPDYWKDTGDLRPHWKWNIHRFAPAGGIFVECANECLTELRRRLERSMA